MTTENAEIPAWLFYQAFALFMRWRPAPPAPAMLQLRKLQLIAVLFYVSAGLTHVIPWLMGQSGEIADGGGHVWQIHDLRETTVAVMLFTMLFTALLAGLRLLRE